MRRPSRSSPARWTAGGCRDRSNFFDSSRALTVRCEPHVGGRLLEVYDLDSGQGLELARITVWEPPDRLGWRSSIDDVEVNVRFDPVGAGSRVTVEVQVPAGGRDQGGSMWVRVAPSWFGAWCGHRDEAPSARPTLGRLALSVAYAEPAAGARWIHDVEEHHAHAQAVRADIVDDLHHHGYRAYTLRDPEGNRWTVAQALPSVQPR